MRRGATLLLLVTLALGACVAPKRPTDAVYRPPTVQVELEDVISQWPRSASTGGFQGQGYIVVNPKEATRTTAGTVAIPAAGRYTIFTRGYVGQDLERGWRLQIDGQPLEVTHGPTRAPGWVWQRAGVADLSAGDTQVQIEATGEDGALADALLFTTEPLDAATIESRWRVLPEDARRVVYDATIASLRRADPVPRVDTADAWQARRSTLKARVRRAIGLDPWPSRGPLDAQVVGRAALDGFTVERVRFESRPGVVVTANVYVPDGAGPFPLVVGPVGHWSDGKAHDSVVNRQQGLAKLGYITIVFDPFGYAERVANGNTHHEHRRLLISGHGNLSIMVWDAIRAIDYMLTRPDVDATRIASTGVSAGGLTTLYLMAVDDRVDVAIPAGYVTTWLEMLTTGLWHDPCSFAPGLASVTDMGEMVALFAPKPVLILDALDDRYFTTAGARRAHEQALERYRLMGVPEALQLRSFPGPHEFSQPMREQLYGFLAHHLQDAPTADPVEEPSLLPIASVRDALQVTQEGRVRAPVSAAVLAKRWAERRVQSLPAPEAFDAGQVRERLVASLRTPADPPAPTMSVQGQVTLGRREVQKLLLRVEPEVTLPGLLSIGSPDAPAVVVADGSRGGTSSLMAAMQAGLTVLYVSPRGQGESYDDESQNADLGVLTGDSLLGRRALDLYQAGRVLRAGLRPGVPVGLVAHGASAGFAGLIAQAVWGSYDVASAGPVSSTYLQGFNARLPTMLWVHDILEVADVPQIVRLASQRPLDITFSDDLYRSAHPAWADRLGASSTRVRVHEPIEVSLHAVRVALEQLR